MEEADRRLIRDMVEDHWRAMLASIHQTKSPGKLPLAFSERINAIAAHMPAEKASIFLKAVEIERERLADEYDRDPLALKRRLNLAVTEPPIRHGGQQFGQRQPLLGVFVLVATIFAVVIGFLSLSW